jgi:RNA polymerase sigma-70 factor (ECF subfamily)
VIPKPTAIAEVTPDFEAFFESEHERLFQALLLLTASYHDADELAQEALLRAYERWDRVGAMDSPVGYVYRTALNLHRSRIRQLTVRARHIFAPIDEEDLSAGVSAAQDVRRALASIPQAQREALILTELLGFGSDEAGRILGIEAASVRGRAYRGRDSLRAKLGDTDE